MRKLFLAGIILLLLGIGWAEDKPVPAKGNPKKKGADKTAELVLEMSREKAMSPRLYLPGYNPLMENRLELYKFDKGMNRYKTKPWEITAFAPEYKETIDFPNRRVTISIMVGEFKIAEDISISFEQYFANLQKKTFRRSLITNLKTQTQQTQVTSSGLIKDLPLLPDIAIPKAVQKVIGSTAGRLNLDGTQKISLSVSNTKRKQVPIYETGSNNVTDLKMEQESNIRLTGTIGDKIAINFKYNSKQEEQLFDVNNVNVKYTGTEDELIKTIEGGNISLSLSGSRYVSYSASSQGLFGITSKFKYKDLDISVITSKEESQKNTQTYVGKSQADSTTVNSWKYSRRTMYFLHDPYELYQLESDTLSVPVGWKNNAIKTHPDGTWMIADANLLPEPGTVRLWVDNPNNNIDPSSQKGFKVHYPDGYLTSYIPYYLELTEGTDFVTDYSSGTVYVLRQIDRNSSVGVRYTSRAGAIVPMPQAGDATSDSLRVKVLRKRNQEYEPYVFTNNNPLNTWHYQMRNVYDMGKTNIRSDGFNLQIFNLNEDLTRNYNLPDNLATHGKITYNDYLRLDTNNDGLINSGDSSVNLSAGWIIMPFIEPLRPLGDRVIYRVENEYEYSYQDSTKLWIGIKGKIGRDAIELSSIGILRGSVLVKVNGNEQRENVDYIVDYDFGRLTFLTPAGKDPEAQIEIEYEARTLFSIAQKNLVGMRADWRLTDNAKLGGTLVYRSENVADKRPRIGNENIEMLMGNIDGELSFKPGFVTKALDALPLINTTAPSTMSISGEVAFTMPNIYGNPDGKIKESYLDDMESIIDSYPLGVTYSTWVLGSKPYNTYYSKARMNWFNAKDIKRSDLEDEDTLTDREKNEYASVLTMISKPNPVQMPGANTITWAGIMKYLGNQVDFSQKKYLEVYVKLDSVANTSVSDKNVTLHIDLGDINEDFYTEYGGDGVLNSEDRNKDGVLTISEDIGLDGVAKNLPGSDPLDIAAPPTGNSYEHYAQVNGTEDNRVLDTEDLDSNGTLNTLDRYFSYSISLSNPDPNLVYATKGNWKLLRIPLNDPNYYSAINSQGNVLPSLNKISYARIWMEHNSPSDVMIRIADIAVVGNKWQDNKIRQFRYGSAPPPSYVQNYNPVISDEILSANNTSFSSGTISNKNNLRYTPPKGTVFQEEKRDTAESALTLEVNNLRRDHMCLLRQRMLDTYDLRSYGKIKFWVYPEIKMGDSLATRATSLDSLDIVFRIGADSLNYYQVRQRVPARAYETSKMLENNWLELEYDLQKLVSLKEINPSLEVDSLFTTESANGIPVNYYYRGKPNLISIREMYLGVYVPDTDTYPYQTEIKTFSGTLFFNDLRVAEPYQDLGIAKRLSFAGTFADVATLNIDLEDKSENFNTTIQRGRANTFTSTRSLNITNKYFLGKLFPNSWNFDIPISLARNYSLGTPRFKANSDLLRENIQSEEYRDLEQTERLAYSADFGFSQKVAPKSKILQYTIYRTSLSGRVENSFNTSATAIDTLLAYRGTLNYNLNIPAEKTSFKLIKNYRLAYFPNTFSNSFSFSANEPKAYDRATTVVDSIVWNKRTQTTDTRILTSDNNLTWNFLSDLSLTARLNTKRDLKQRDSLWTVNIGKLNEYVQDLGFNYNPNYMPRVLNFTSSVSARYSDTQRKYYQTVDGQSVEVFQRDGTTNRSIRMNMTLLNSSIFADWAEKLKSKSPKPQDKPNDQSQTSPPRQDDKDEEYMPDDKKEPRFSDEQLKQMEKLNWEQEQKDKERLKQEDEQKKEEKEVIPEDKPESKEEEFPSLPGLTDDKDIAPEDRELQTGDDPKPPKTPKEPKPSINPVAGFFSLLSKLKNINAAYQNSYTMNYVRKEDPYPFAFQIGLPQFDRIEDGLDAIGNDNTLTLGSGIMLSRSLDSVLNFSYTNNMREADASQQTIGYTFPDITVSLMDFDKLVGISKFVTGSRLNTGFQYTVRQNGNLYFDKPKQETFTTAFNPLLGFTGNLFKVVTTNLSYARSQTKNLTDLSITADNPNYVTKIQNSQTMNGNLSYSFRAGKGFTIPFTKKRIHIKNELTSTLGLAYENNYDTTEGSTTTLVEDRDTSRLSITPQATYQFDTNIRGGLTGKYEINSDRKREDGSTIFSLGIWVEINL